ncbi:MAG: hypothetical protein FJZ90_15260 [Chloroflexi bacterium]|nr:hypothetical protein [Chloroflexota bacterium]
MTTQAGSSVTPTRLVLEGVPKIGFYEGGLRCPEDIALPSVLRALTEYLRDEDYGCRHCRARKPNCQTDCSYAFFLGVTGAAFFLSWKEGWHGDNPAAFYLSRDPAAMEKNAFRAMGYAFEGLAPQPGRDNEAVFRQAIAESIGRGMPVIAYGVIGPPDPGLIAGYDEGGDVLIGWSFFQGFLEFGAGLEFEPSGYYRKRLSARDWAKDVQRLVVVGERGARPSLKETYRAALEFGLQVARTPMVRPEADAPEPYRQRHNGLAAYTAWAEHILRDEAFPADDEATLRAHHRVHDDAVGTVAEARWYGAQFLLGMTNHTDIHVHRDMIEDLLHAAALYAGEHELMWRLWDLAGGIGNPEGYRKMADADVRREMAQVILEARDKDARAADHLERALAKDR